MRYFDELTTFVKAFKMFNKTPVETTLKIPLKNNKPDNFYG